MLFDDENWKVIHKSRPPLRWIANLAGEIATSGLLDISYMEEYGYTGWKYKYKLWKWKIFWPLHEKYGTYYKLVREDDYE